MATNLGEVGGCADQRKKMPSGLESVLLDNLLDLPKESINKVKAVEGEIRMHNIQNRKVLSSEEGCNMWSSL